MDKKDFDELVIKLDPILKAIVKAGGEPFFVGGFVRDYYISSVTKTPQKSKDLDVEVFKLPLERLESVLSGFGQVDLIGKAFGILKLHGFSVNGIDVDFSLPRKDNKIGIGHKDFKAEIDENMSLEDAARRRDLTMNSMSMNPFTHEIIDLFNGKQDILNCVLNATDNKTFLEDPLRSLRVAQFISRFDMMTPSDDLLNLCKQADLSPLPGERFYPEFIKLLTGNNPAKGLEFLKTTGLVRFFPELQALISCPQWPTWHPEGATVRRIITK